MMPLVFVVTFAFGFRCGICIKKRRDLHKLSPRTTAIVASTVTTYFGILQLADTLFQLFNTISENLNSVG